MRKKLISNKTLTIRILLFLLIVSVFSIIIATIYIKHTALENLAEDDAKNTSELIFETMYARMQQGWGKDDLSKILKRMENIRDGLEVHSYRSNKVEEILGVHEEDKKIINNDILLQKALKGKKQFIVNEDGSVRYIFPIKVSSECTTCHYNTKVNDVNGVLDIKYPPKEIKISLDMMIYYFLAFFLFFIIVYSFLFYKIINIKLIKPIVNLTNEIINVTKNQNFDKRVTIKAKTIEVYTLQEKFNKLIDTITYYYNKLLNNLYTDSLTKLPNIIKLQEKLKNKERICLAIVAIDSFKNINNFYGLKVGDFILKEVAQILKEYDKDWEVFRLYSDEFAIFSKHLEINKCKKLLEDIKEHKFIYDENIISIQATIGLIKESKNRQLEKATMAVRGAKKEKKDICVFHKNLILKEVYEKQILMAKLIKEALKNEKIINFYQGIINSKSEKIEKYEVLVRLKNNDKILAPIEFLDISKQSKQYDLITKTVIKNSFTYFKNKKHLGFSINFSMDDIKNSETVQFLIKMLKEYKIGNRLTIELLETEELTDFSMINNFINEVKKYEVSIAIDDFGSGYSNFSYITKLPIDYLKIDSSLIENLHESKQSLKMVRSIINFARDLKIKTVAEKVHNEEIYNILKELKVDFMQGYYIQKPKEEVD